MSVFRWYFHENFFIFVEQYCNASANDWSVVIFFFFPNKEEL